MRWVIEVWPFREVVDFIATCTHRVSICLTSPSHDAQRTRPSTYLRNSILIRQTRVLLARLVLLLLCLIVAGRGRVGP
jgi:hypothetical protein